MYKTEVEMDRADKRDLLFLFWMLMAILMPLGFFGMTIGAAVHFFPGSEAPCACVCDEGY